MGDPPSTDLKDALCRRMLSKQRTRTTQMGNTDKSVPQPPDHVSREAAHAGLVSLQGARSSCEAMSDNDDSQLCLAIIRKQ